MGVGLFVATTPALRATSPQRGIKKKEELNMKRVKKIVIAMMAMIIAAMSMGIFFGCSCGEWYRDEKIGDFMSGFTRITAR